MSAVPDVSTTQPLECSVILLNDHVASHFDVCVCFHFCHDGYFAMMGVQVSDGSVYLHSPYPPRKRSHRLTKRHYSIA